MKPSFDDALTNYAKNYCNRTPIVEVIVENVVTCFLGTRCITATYFVAFTDTNNFSEIEIASCIYCY